MIPVVKRVSKDLSGLHVGPSAGFVDLSLIGVPQRYTTRPPVPDAYPQKYNDEAKPIWDKLVRDPLWKLEIRDLRLEHSWNRTILEFLRRANSSGVLPFANNTDIAKNEYVKEFIVRSRRQLVDYVNEIGIFKRVRIRKVFREYIRKDNGLVIRSWVDLFVIKDPDFEKWLRQAPLPRFWKKNDKTYVRIVRPHVHMWVKFVNRNRTLIGFEITVAGTINIPGKKSPTKQEVNDFIDRTIFLPTIRSHRFRGVTTRLF